MKLTAIAKIIKAQQDTQINVYTFGDTQYIMANNALFPLYRMPKLAESEEVLEILGIIGHDAENYNIEFNFPCCPECMQNINSENAGTPLKSLPFEIVADEAYQIFQTENERNYVFLNKAYLAPIKDIIAKVNEPVRYIVQQESHGSFYMIIKMGFIPYAVIPVCANLADVYKVSLIALATRMSLNTINESLKKNFEDEDDEQ